MAQARALKLFRVQVEYRTPPRTMRGRMRISSSVYSIYARAGTERQAAGIAKDVHRESDVEHKHPILALTVYRMTEPENEGPGLVYEPEQTPARFSGATTRT